MPRYRKADVRVSGMGTPFVFTDRPRATVQVIANQVFGYTQTNIVIPDEDDANAEPALLVYGLGDPAGWDAIELTRWARFVKAVA